MKDIRGETIRLGDLVVFTPTDRYGASTLGRVVRTGKAQIQIANRGTRIYWRGRRDIYTLTPMRRTEERVMVLERAPAYIRQQLHEWCRTKPKDRQEFHIIAGMSEDQFADWTDTWEGGP